MEATTRLCHSVGKRQEWIKCYGGSNIEMLREVAELVPTVDPRSLELARRGRLPGLEDSVSLVEGLAFGFEPSEDGAEPARQKLEARLLGIKKMLAGAHGNYPELREELLADQVACEDELERLEA